MSHRTLAISFSIFWVFAGVVGSNAEANKYRFFPKYDPNPSPDTGELIKEVSNVDDFTRLSVKPTDPVVVYVTRLEDRFPLLEACANAKLESLTVWIQSEVHDSVRPLALGPLIENGPSSLRQLSVLGFDGVDGWEELPAERFPSLEYLRVDNTAWRSIGGMTLTRVSGKWFAALPALTYLDLFPGVISDGAISALSTAKLKGLDVSGEDISCNAFRAWKGNESLEFLSAVSLNADTAEDVNILAELKNLRSLDVAGELNPCLPELYERLSKLESLTADIEDERTMLVLSKMPNLRHLSIASSLLTSDELEVLCDGANLESLIIGNCAKVDDRGVAAIGRMKGLRSLALTSTGMTDQSMDVLAGLHELECLNLYSCNVTTAGFAKLASLQKLRWIDIRLTDILPDATPTILRLKNLEEIVVTGPQWKPADNKALKALLPKLKINDQ